MEELTHCCVAESLWERGDSWGIPVPPLDGGAMARKEGALTQSREGLGGSPDQVVGQRPAIEPVCLGNWRESPRLADRVIRARMGGTTEPAWSQGPVGRDGRVSDPRLAG
jgi:hypothetical protein